MLLEITWYFIWSLLWCIFFVTGGFDLGIGILYPFIGKNEEEKKNIIYSIGPLWDGNEVWLITATGVTFAAFPKFYSLMFSILYSPLMIVLFALIIRGVSFEFRNKIDSIIWKKTWDFAIFSGSFITTFFLGIIFSNLFIGIPISHDCIFIGNFLTFFNFYGILGGILFSIFFILHGSIWLLIKSEQIIKNKIKKIVYLIIPIMIICLITFLTSSFIVMKLYKFHSKLPFLFINILILVYFHFKLYDYLKKGEYIKTFLISSNIIIFSIFFCIIGLYPNLLKSSISETYSLTIFNSASTQLTLKIMLLVVSIFIPITIAYQTWAYILFKEKITNKDLINNKI